MERVGKSLPKPRNQVASAELGSRASRVLTEGWLANNRPDAVIQRALIAGVHSGHRQQAQQHRIDRLFGAQASLDDPAHGLLQGRFATVQRAEKAPMRVPRENRTGLPDALKSGVESLSGLSLDSVKVHYNSAQPAQVGALAYAQGSDIHLGPGQEKHLAHEAWHVVQQAQGRVRPTLQLRRGVPVNDSQALEREADAMGEKALAPAAQRGCKSASEAKRAPGISAQSPHAGLMQREKKVVAGVDVDTDAGYTNWEGWHINWRLGSKKNGAEQYHLTSQDRTQHYFFIINGSDLEDTKPPAKLVPKRGTSGGLSSAPKSVQDFIRTNINELLP